MKVIFSQSYENSLGAEFGLTKAAGFGTGHWQTKGFRDCLSKLPPQIQKLANEKYQMLLSNPQQVGIKPMVENGFKIPIWSAQVGGGHRALALKYQSYYVWYWIGTHEEYNRVKGMPASKEAVDVVNGIARKLNPGKPK